MLENISLHLRREAVGSFRILGEKSKLRNYFEDKGFQSNGPDIVNSSIKNRCKQLID